MINEPKYNYKRNEILDTALELFVAFGFYGIPLSKIAAEAGVHKDTLFRYFKTRDELIIALYIDVKEKMVAYVGNPSAGASTLKEQFRGLFVHSMHWALQNRQAFRFIQQFHASPFLSQISPEMMRQQLAEHLELIRQGIYTQLIKSNPVDYIYALITGQILGVFQYIVNGSFNEEKQTQVINKSFDLLWLMLK